MMNAPDVSSSSHSQPNQGIEINRVAKLVILYEYEECESKIFQSRRETNISFIIY